MPQDNPPDVVHLAQRAGFEEDIIALLAPKLTPLQAVGRLLEAGRADAAVRLWAWVLGRREAVWWASQCVRRVLTDKDPPAEHAAVAAAEKWAALPSEENRRRAEAAAVAVNFGTPGGCAALAAFWSGGSLAPPKLEVVPPPEHLLPGAVGNSVILAGLKGDPQKAGEKYRLFLDLGREVAEGKNRWKEEKPAAPAAASRTTVGKR